MRLGRLALPSGGGEIYWRDTDDLVGRDMRTLRQCLNHEGSADRFAAAIADGCAVLVDTFTVDYIPAGTAKRNLPDLLKRGDLLALERTLGPLVLSLVRDEEPALDNPDHPSTPASA